MKNKQSTTPRRAVRRPAGPRNAPGRRAPRPRQDAAPGAEAGPATGERLQKILAGAGIASRRAAEEMIAAGRVTVNGVVAVEMGSKADPNTDLIAVDGKPVKPAGTAAGQRLIYLAVNKPLGVVSTAKDTHRRPTVLSLLEGASLKEQGIRLYPVGRLDIDTTGLLLLTNDGDLTFRLTHPRYGVEKEYRALVRGRPGEDAVRKLREGVMVEGSLTAPAKVEDIGRHEGNTLLRVTIHEGRKRQIRLMTAAIGHPVLELQRTRFGSVELGTLEPGKWRNLAAHEVHALQKAAGIKPTNSREVVPHQPAEAGQKAPAGPPAKGHKPGLRNKPALGGPRPARGKKPGSAAGPRQSGPPRPAKPRRPSAPAAGRSNPNSRRGG